MYFNQRGDWQPLDHGRLRQQRSRHALQTALLLGLLALVPLLLAALLGGMLLVAIVAGVLVGLYFNNPLARPEVILRWQHGEPLDEWDAPGLYAVTRELAHRAGLPALPRLYYLPSATPNAFTTGTAAAPVIALSDGLLRNMSRQELAGILAHEISHVYSEDMRLMQFASLMSAITGWLAAAGQLLVLVNLPLYLAGLAFINWWVVLVLLLAPGFHLVCQLALSRTREYEADAMAARLLGDPGPLVAALSRLERASVSPLEYLFGQAQRRENVLLSTHPPTRERIERLRGLQRFQAVASDPGAALRAFLLGRGPVRRRDEWF